MKYGRYRYRYQCRYFYFFYFFVFCYRYFFVLKKNFKRIRDFLRLTEYELTTLLANGNLDSSVHNSDRTFSKKKHTKNNF